MIVTVHMIWQTWRIIWYMISEWDSWIPSLDIRYSKAMMVTSRIWCHIHQNRKAELSIFIVQSNTWSRQSIDFNLTVCRFLLFCIFVKQLEILYFNYSVLKNLYIFISTLKLLKRDILHMHIKLLNCIQQTKGIF